MPLYCDEVIFLQGNLEVVSCPELHGNSNWWVGTCPYLQILKKEYESEPCLRKTSILLTLKHFLSHPPLVCSLSLVPLSANIYLLTISQSRKSCGLPVVSFFWVNHSGSLLKLVQKISWCRQKHLLYITCQEKMRKLVTHVGFVHWWEEHQVRLWILFLMEVFTHIKPS